jgi:predicted small metal-binding protein
MRSSSISIYTRLEDKNMDERDIVLNSVLEELKNKKLITELEEDIISAIKVYIKKPFNRRDVELKILEIESKYNYLINFANLVQNPVKCPIDSLNDSELRNNLYSRIIKLLSITGKQNNNNFNLNIHCNLP